MRKEKERREKDMANFDLRHLTSDRLTFYFNFIDVRLMEAADSRFIVISNDPYKCDNRIR